MSKRRNQPYKKTNEMVSRYKQELKNPKIELEDTTNNNMMNLESSDIPSEIKTEDIPIQKKGIILQTKDWFKQNWIGAILFASIVLLFQWGIETKVSIAEIKIKLEHINEIVTKLDDSYVRKEEVKIEIENIKSLINANGYKDLNDIKYRVNELEKIIKY